MEKASPYWLASGILAGVSLGVAWLLPATTLGAILGWIAIFAIVACAESSRPYLSSYIVGCVAIGTAFYWIPSTVQDFGGFETIPAYAVHALFIFGTAIQFLIFCFATKTFNRISWLTSLAPALGWIASEWLWIRIFPWEPAHSQLGFRALIQIADIGGTTAITFLMFWLASVTLNANRQQRITASFSVAFLALAVSLGYGIYKIKWVSNLSAPLQSVALIQANISTEEKHNIRLFAQNTDQYKRLTLELAEKTKDSFLVLWPESVIQDWTPTNIKKASRMKNAPRLPDRFALITGALTFDNPDVRYNSALTIYQDGSIPIPYHKRILMPFGEYMPGSKWFPWIQDLNPLAAGFSAGTEQTVFSIPMRNGKKSVEVRAAPLICYEDVLPSLSRQAVKESDANLLVNLTNDGWFGRSHASMQHLQIAAFRAVENKRYLLRATNTGVTAVIDPTGEVVATLPIYSEGRITAKVKLNSEKTLFTQYVGHFPRYLVLFLLACILLFRRKEKEG